MTQNVPPPIQVAVPKSSSPAPTWTSAIGLVSLLVAIVTMLNSGIMVLATLATFRVSLPDYLLTEFMLRGVVAVGTVAMSALLLFGAILLMQRKPAAILLHQLYAFGTLGLQLLAFLLGVFALAAEYPLPWQSSMWRLTALAAPYPIFCLLWFFRRNVRIDLQNQVHLHSK